MSQERPFPQVELYPSPFNESLVWINDELFENGFRPKFIVILDLDGVVIQDSDFFTGEQNEAVKRDPSYFNLEQGNPLAAIAKLVAAGGAVFIATNKSSIGKNKITPAELSTRFTKLQAALGEYGGQFAGYLVCPHKSDAGCDCRKPGLGMYHALRNDLREIYDIDVTSTPLYFVGDKGGDVETGKRIDPRYEPGLDEWLNDIPDPVCITALVETGYGKDGYGPDEFKNSIPNFRFPDLAAVADFIAVDAATRALLTRTLAQALMGEGSVEKALDATQQVQSIQDDSASYRLLMAMMRLREQGKLN